MRWTKRTVGFLLGIMTLAGAAVGQSIPTADVRGEGTPRFDPTQIVFKPGAGHVGLTLSVSGPEGYQLRQDYEPGVNPTFSVRDLSDGLYSYELRIAKALSTPDDIESSEATRAGVPSNERGMRQTTKQPQDAVVQSGHFQIEAGSLVLRNLVERGGRAPLPELERTDQTGLATKDICHNDDLIVDGSLCVGFDCICNQAFGFDTIILKENNLRIFFDDTSVAASFPRNDWRIVINDSANGGASYFGIEDSTAGRRVFTIEAGAPSHSLYVDDGGRLGLGTSTPSVELHTKDGDTPTLRLEQDGSSGFAPQTWDVAGNETNFFIRDVTHGSALPFRIRPGAPTSAIDIAADGNVGIGTTSPAGALEIHRNGSVSIGMNNTDQSVMWYFNNDTVGNFSVSKLGTGATELVLDGGGDLTIRGSLTTQNPAGTFPDYVFDASYSLLSLSSLAEFIKLNRRLPNLLSAEDIETEGGLNMSKLQLKLLEKIEELTLYTLQQQEDIWLLKARLEELEKTE